RGRRAGGTTVGAGSGAEDEAGPGQEGSPQQGQLTAGAAEAGLHRVPVLTLVRHLALSYTLVNRINVTVSQYSCPHVATIPALFLNSTEAINILSEQRK
uniref:Uncharacterized protein n=1 Tax=Cynoglossus semilaevis TaxID=244447 RepID=A0A3P8WZ90_CYNSE